jgi:hypothetical protein
MNRFLLTSAFLLACVTLALSPVKAFSPSQIDPAVRTSSGMVQVSAKCNRVFRQCKNKCKKDQSCIDLCILDRDVCDTFNPSGTSPW